MATPRTILRKARTMVTMDSAQRALMAEAIISMAVAQACLLIFPFRKVAARLGQLTPAGEATPVVTLAGPEEKRLAADIGWAVRRAAGYAPFRAVCLQQAIAARFMLRRRGLGSVMHFGMARPSGGGLRAHAWLDAGEIRVTGYPVGAEFVEVACFV